MFFLLLMSICDRFLCVYLDAFEAGYFRKQFGHERSDEFVFSQTISDQELSDFMDNFDQEYCVDNSVFSQTVPDSVLCSYMDSFEKQLSCTVNCDMDEQNGFSQGVSDAELVKCVDDYENSLVMDGQHEDKMR